MDETELERWWSEGIPPDMFKYPEMITWDMRTLIGVIKDYVDHKFEELKNGD